MRIKLIKFIGNPGLSLLLVCFLISVIGCAQKKKEEYGAGTNHILKSYSESDLERIILAGMSEKELTNTFGFAASVTPHAPNVRFLMFTIPSNENLSKRVLAGFTVEIMDGKVVRWLPITRGAGEDSKKLFKVYIATEADENIIDAVKIKGSAPEAQLARPPNWVFTAKVFIGGFEEEKKGEWPLVLVLSDSDAAELRSLSDTSDQVRFLIVFENTVIAAPLVSTPSVSKQVQFSIRDSKVAELLRDER